MLLMAESLWKLKEEEMGLSLEMGQSIAQDQQVLHSKLEAASCLADSFSSGNASVSVGRRPWFLLIIYGWSEDDLRICFQKFWHTFKMVNLL